MLYPQYNRNMKNTQYPTAVLKPEEDIAILIAIPIKTRIPNIERMAIKHPKVPFFEEDDCDVE